MRYSVRAARTASRMFVVFDDFMNKPFAGPCKWETAHVLARHMERSRIVPPCEYSAPHEDEETIRDHEWSHNPWAMRGEL